MSENTTAGFKSGNASGNKWQGGKGDTAGTEFNDHLMGSLGDDVVDAGAGDDVVIGFAGTDLLEGGTGRDSLSGGAGDDTLVGSEWDDANLDGIVDFAEVIDDAQRDSYVGDATFEENGTDTVYGYGAGDVIDLSSALVAQFDAEVVIALGDSAAAWDALVAGGYLSYSDGTVYVDQDGAGEAEANAWFVVHEAGEAGWQAAGSVVVLIGSYEGTFSMPVAVL